MSERSKPSFEDLPDPVGSFAAIIVGGAKRGEDVTDRPRLELTPVLDRTPEAISKTVAALNEPPIAIYSFARESDGKRTPVAQTNLPNICRDIIANGYVRGGHAMSFETFEIISPDESIPETFSAHQIAIVSLAKNDRLVVTGTVKLKDPYYAA